MRETDSKFVYRMHYVREPANCFIKQILRSSNASHLYLQGFPFESRPGHRLSTNPSRSSSFPEGKFQHSRLTLIHSSLPSSHSTLSSFVTDSANKYVNNHQINHYSVLSLMGCRQCVTHTHTHTHTHRFKRLYNVYLFTYMMHIYSTYIMHTQYI